MRRIMKMIAGGGLSITGSHSLCGDYLYSGHTVMLTLTYLFIKECKLHCWLQRSVSKSHRLAGLPLGWNVQDSARRTQPVKTLPCYIIALSTFSVIPLSLVIVSTVVGTDGVDGRD